MLKMDQKDTDMNEKGVTSSTSGVVVQVREKKGPLRAAIPYMPFPVAVICLFLNTFVPGLGTFVSAFTVLCGARTDLPDRHMCCVFWLNIAAAFIQILTAIVMVGWIMSIFWGMDMVILAISDGTYCMCSTTQSLCFHQHVAASSHSLPPLLFFLFIPPPPFWLSLTLFGFVVLHHARYTGRHWQDRNGEIAGSALNVLS
uniref:Stum, mechanosensory transduction mediator homolog n=1 Tax=Oncorhynchus tshawytscha TaxID=74940 RepID=A0AAZ3SK61_ONCTS